MKEKGVSLLCYKFSSILSKEECACDSELVPLGKSSLRTLFYRSFNTAKTNRLRFTSLLVADIVNYDIKGLTNDSRKSVFIIYDSLFKCVS